MRVRQPNNSWPSTTWEPLRKSRSERWITIFRAPVPHIQLRERGDDNTIVPVPLGMPFPLNPGTEYEIRNIGDPDIDLITAVAPADGVFAWTNRRTLFVLSDVPLPLTPEVAFGFTLQNANALGVTLNPVRHTTMCLQRMTCTWCANGTVTFAVSSGFDPKSPTIGTTEVRVFKALGANIPRVFTFAVAGGNFDVDDNAVQINGRGAVPAGMLEGVIFPVTTTPTVSFRFRGLL